MIWAADDSSNTAASEKSEENTIVDLIISERKRRRQTDQARLLSCLLQSQTTDLFNKRLKQFMWATCQYYYYYSLLFCLQMQMEMDRMDSRISSPKMTKFPTGASAALSVVLSILIAMEAV